MVEGANQVGQENILAKKYQNTGNFSGSYYKGHSQQTHMTNPIQSASSAFTSHQLVAKPSISKV